MLGVLVSMQLMQKEKKKEKLYFSVFPSSLPHQRYYHNRDPLMCVKVNDNLSMYQISFHVIFFCFF